MEYLGSMNTSDVSHPLPRPESDRCTSCVCRYKDAGQRHARELTSMDACMMVFEKIAMLW